MINEVVEMGRLTADPELKQTQSGNSVANFTLAVDRSYCKAGSERQTDFIDCTAWRGTGEFIAKYFKKGQMIAITGSIQTGTYTGKDGNKRKSFSVNVNQASFCGSKKEQGTETDSNPYPSGDTAAPKADGKSGDFEEVPDGDDLPF
jgi:single-strand DNA-binding protein